MLNHSQPSSLQSEENCPPRNLAIALRAIDVPKLCKILKRDLQHRETEIESYTLMALLSTGWPREQLRSWIWYPLTSLRHKIFQSCMHNISSSRFYYKIKVLDRTGTFERTNNPVIRKGESQHEDSPSDNPETYSHDEAGYESDRECRMCTGCGMDYETADESDWNSEEDDSNHREDLVSGEDPDGNAESHNHTSATEVFRNGHRESR